MKKHILNLNVIHNGVSLNKGQECPEKFLDSLKKYCHVLEIEEQKVELKQEPVKKGKQK